MDKKVAKRQATIIAKYGSFEAYRKAARAWGKKGGETGSNGLVKLTPEQRSQAGKKGYQARVDKLRKELQEELSHETHSS